MFFQFATQILLIIFSFCLLYCQITLVFQRPFRAPHLSKPSTFRRKTFWFFMTSLICVVNHTGIFLDLVIPFLTWGMNSIWASINVVLNSFQAYWRDLNLLTVPFNFLLTFFRLLNFCKAPLSKSKVIVLDYGGNFPLTWMPNLIVLWSLFPVSAITSTSHTRPWALLRTTSFWKETEKEMDHTRSWKVNMNCLCSAGRWMFFICVASKAFLIKTFSVLIWKCRALPFSKGEILVFGKITC